MLHLFKICFPNQILDYREKNLHGTNTLAYFSRASVTKKKVLKGCQLMTGISS